MWIEFLKNLISGGLCAPLLGISGGAP